MSLTHPPLSTTLHFKKLYTKLTPVLIVRTTNSNVNNVFSICTELLEEIVSSHKTKIYMTSRMTPRSSIHVDKNHLDPFFSNYG